MQWQLQGWGPINNPTLWPKRIAYTASAAAVACLSDNDISRSPSSFWWRCSLSIHGSRKKNNIALFLMISYSSHDTYCLLASQGVMVVRFRALTWGHIDWTKGHATNTFHFTYLSWTRCLRSLFIYETFTFMCYINLILAVHLSNDICFISSFPLEN